VVWAFLVKQLLKGELLHEDVNTIVGKGLTHYTKNLSLMAIHWCWRDGPAESLDLDASTTY